MARVWRVWVMAAVLVAAGGRVADGRVAGKPIVDPGLFVIQGVTSCGEGQGYCMLGSNCTVDVDFLQDANGGHCNGLREAFTPKIDFVCCRYNPLGKATSEPPTTTLSPVTITDIFSLVDEQVLQQQQQQQEMDYENLNPENLIDIVGVVTDFTGIIGLVTRPWTGTIPTRAPTTPTTPSTTPLLTTTTTPSSSTTNVPPTTTTITTTPSSSPTLSSSSSPTTTDTTTTTPSSSLILSSLSSSTTNIPTNTTTTSLIHSTTSTTAPPTTTHVPPTATTTTTTTATTTTTTTTTATTTTTTSLDDGDLVERGEVTESYNEVPTTMDDQLTTLPTNPATMSTTPPPSTTSSSPTTHPDTTTTKLTTDSTTRPTSATATSSPTTATTSEAALATPETKTTTTKSTTTSPTSPTTTLNNNSRNNNDKNSTATTITNTTTITDQKNITAPNNVIVFPKPHTESSIPFPQPFPGDTQALQGVPESVVTPEGGLDGNLNDLDSNIVFVTPDPLASTQAPVDPVGVVAAGVLVEAEAEEGQGEGEPDYTYFTDYQDQILLQPINQNICGFKGPRHYVPDNSPSRILGGLAASTVEWCWAAAIMERSGSSEGGLKFVCSGALAETNLVLTTATCIKRLEGKELSKFVVVLGDSNLSDHLPYGIQFHTPAEVMPHPDYFTSGGAHVNDIGLVRLQDHATLSDNVCLVCVAQQDAILPPSAPCVVVGYGRPRMPPAASFSTVHITDGAALAAVAAAKEGVLRQLPVPVLRPAECAKALRNLTGSGILATSDSYLCASRLDNTAACYNALDGGSPLACEAGGRWFIAGLVSWSKDCGLPGVPTIFTRVTAFTNWVQTAYLRMLGFTTRPVYSYRTRWMYDRLEKINKEFA